MSFDAHYDDEAWALVFTEVGAPPFGAWEEQRHVFVVADLQDPSRWTELVGRQPPFVPALALGFRRVMLEVDGARMPFMLETDDPQRALLGTLYLGLSAAELGLVEVVMLAGDHRRRIELEVAVGERRVAAIGYVRRG